MVSFDVYVEGTGCLPAMSYNWIGKWVVLWHMLAAMVGFSGAVSRGYLIIIVTMRPPVVRTYGIYNT